MLHRQFEHKIDHLLDARQLRHLLNGNLLQSIRRLYVQDGQIRIILVDGRRLRFTMREINLTRAQHNGLSNKQSVRLVVGRLVMWRLRQGPRALMHEIIRDSLHLIVTQQVLNQAPITGNIKKENPRPSR